MTVRPALTSASIDLPLSMHDAPAGEHSGPDGARYVSLSEGQHRPSHGRMSLSRSKNRRN